MRITSTKYALAGTALLLAVTMSACGGDDENTSDDASASASSSAGEDSGDESGADADTDEDAEGEPTGQLGEFCDAYISIGEDLAGLTGTDAEQTTAAVAALKGWVGRMEEVGTPDEIPEDADAGFEVIVGAVGDLDDDATLEDLNGLETNLSPDEVTASQAFSTWAAGECAPAAPDVPEVPEPSASTTP